MLSIIIPTRDKAPRLRLTLQALAEARYRCGLPMEVIVVDDGSRDETSEVLEALEPRIGNLKVVRRAGPGGRSVARNAGGAASQGTCLLFLDDDMLVGEQLLRRHLSAHEDAPRWIIARATILNLPWMRFLKDPSHVEDGLPPKLAARLRSVAGAGSLIDAVALYGRRSSFEADLHALLSKGPGAPCAGRWMAATGGNLSISREAFEQLGGFDERMGLRWGAEDLEFGFRAEAAGVYLVQLADVAAYHMDHEGGDRRGDHDQALHYFGEKHGRELGQRLAGYFRGTLPLEDVLP